MPQATALLSATGFDLAAPDAAMMARLIAGLSDEERRVLLDHGTEHPFCGTLLDNKLTGTYACRVCGLPLFSSATKFNSGTGWPSFWGEFDPAHVRRIIDRSHGMIRTEIRCARCDSHLGHVFPDGPPPTGERHCLNSISMMFVANGDRLPDPMGRGGAEAQPLSL
jgi:peptide-methionine (R)-S-oxide reductase